MNTGSFLHVLVTIWCHSVSGNCGVLRTPVQDIGPFMQPHLVGCMTHVAPKLKEFSKKVGPKWRLMKAKCVATPSIES